MAVSQVKRAAGAQHFGNDLAPATDVRQPADRAPGDVGHVEGSGIGDRRNRVVKIGLDKSRPVSESEFRSQGARRFNRRAGEVEAHYRGGAMLEQLQGVRTEMALQV